MLREFGERVESVVLDGLGRSVSRIQEQKPLSVDLLEDDESYIIVFDAPGATSNDVDVRFDDRTVHVRVDRFRDTYEGFDMKLRGRGLSLSGSVSLPEHASVDPESATATLTDSGTLQVTLPKTGSDSADDPIRIETDRTQSKPDHDSDSDSDADSDSDSVDSDDSGGASDSSE
ncbi:Hsp20/alpha crystallin family protein [Halocatena marina]|uniref:Hsp20/alpha crystallin family protein n=1 Tax=Halocatena marina TaxID=2934937 RepID=A0ABD5YQE6_9EURY|nr:Hsp20/alpha crystallin family protein [Halocatena marina]